MGAVVAALVVGVASVGAQAARIDLTGGNGSSGTANGAIFQFDTTQPTGTGVLQPFVRMQATGTEQGYNTSGRPVAFDENSTANWTHDVQLQDLRIVGDYYEFILDINEPGVVPESLLSLDEIQIYTSSVGGKTTTNLSQLGTLRYDLDAGEDNHILMDYLNAGSGVADMRALIPVSAFAGASPTDYMYFYSQFGLQEGAAAGSGSADGYEEWAVVPEPASAGLLLMAMGLLLRRRRRSK